MFAGFFDSYHFEKNLKHVVQPQTLVLHVQKLGRRKAAENFTTPSIQSLLRVAYIPSKVSSEPIHNPLHSLSTRKRSKRQTGQVGTAENRVQTATASHYDPSTYAKKYEALDQAQLDMTSG